MPREREYASMVQDLLDGERKIHNELGRREHAGARMNHSKYHTGMQQTK